MTENARFRTYNRMGPPENCVECPTAKGVVAACNAAVKLLRQGYDQRPDYVPGREQNCWVETATDARLRDTDPTYAALVGQYSTANAQRLDIKDHCPGGLVERASGAAALHHCQYQPSPGLPELPVPPGSTPLVPKGGV
ncbi:MAG TPA: hypothetical protein VF466_01520 [Candidatus Saccharimonadales bacterium]